MFERGETQSMLGDMLARLLDDENGFEARRHRLMAATPDRMAPWPHLAGQGILGAAFAEAAGGFGGTIRDLAVVMSQVGRSLVVEPVLSTVLGGRALVAAGQSVDALIAGEVVLAFAHAEGADPFAGLAATANGDRLTGVKVAVRHADLASAFIVSANGADGPGLYLVEAGGAGVTRDAFRLIDGSSAATLRFDGAHAQRLGGADMLADALLWSSVGLASETCGIIAAVNAATFAYLQTRKQFGVPLATFQALQHRAADMYAAAEEARILTGRAIDAVDAAAPGRFALASAAKALTDEMGRKCGHEGVQLHGGMGVSDELDISHYARRLAAIRAEMGSAEMHRARFALLSRENAHAA